MQFLIVFPPPQRFLQSIKNKCPHHFHFSDFIDDQIIHNVCMMQELHISFVRVTTCSPPADGDKHIKRDGRKKEEAFQFNQTTSFLH